VERVDNAGVVNTSSFDGERKKILAIYAHQQRVESCYPFDSLKVYADLKGETMMPHGH